ncbi:MAG: hypothetical protein LLG01_11750 [Planctomycetaceae bacterium]|nr:hypothetical protein [Planctomycetaceae bacterium]
MSDELSYALITPYSLLKSRTGGIISRLLANAQLELVATRMYVFSDAFVDAYKKVICPDDTLADFADAWRRYLDENLRQKNQWGHVPRCMLLLFRGANAVRHLKDDVVGSFTDQPVGNTIRGTYGDLIRNKDGSIRHFEPAVITCPTPSLAAAHLKLLADFAVSDGGLLTGRLHYPEPPQVSLVMLKPDNFYTRSRRPGYIIDTFSLTGLRIVAAKLFNMTVAQGEEFYGPLKDIFVSKLKFLVTRAVMERLHDAFDFQITDADANVLADHLAQRNAATEFNKIVEYMTGVNPTTISADEKATASRTRCLALLYEGPRAIDSIREVLGSTDPSKAQPGTVRSDFGRDLMRNGAHASDSTDSALRERKIVGLAAREQKTCDVSDIINAYLAAK